MERQAGLGRSLGDVLDSLAPPDADASAPGRVLFEPEGLEQQLDGLMADIRGLRERVQHLVGLVPEAELDGEPLPAHTATPEPTANRVEANRVEAKKVEAKGKPGKKKKDKKKPDKKKPSKGAK